MEKMPINYNNKKGYNAAKEIPTDYKKVFLKMQKEGPLEVNKSKEDYTGNHFHCYIDVLDCKKGDVLVLTRNWDFSSDYEFDCKNTHTGEKIELSWAQLCLLLQCNVCKIIKIETYDEDEDI